MESFLIKSHLPIWNSVQIFTFPIEDVLVEEDEEEILFFHILCLCFIPPIESQHLSSLWVVNDKVPMLKENNNNNN